MKASICIEVLRIFEWYRSKYNVECYGYVLMPDHLHALLRQNGDSAEISKLFGAFKSYTSRHITIDNYPDTTIWRDYFDSVPVPGTDAQRTKLKYIHENPLRRGFVERIEDYLWSNARAYLLHEAPHISLAFFADAGKIPD